VSSCADGSSGSGRRETRVDDAPRPETGPVGMATRMAGALARWATRRRPDGCPPGGRSSWGGWLPTPRVVGMQLAVGAGAGAGMSRGLSTSACAGAGMSAGFVRLHIRGGGLRGHGGRGGRPGGRRAEAVLARGVHWTTAPRSSSSPPASSNPWSRLHPIANPHGFGKPGKFDSGGKAALMKGKGPRGHSPEELPQLSNYEQPLIVPPSPQELAQNAGPMQIVIQRCEGIRWRVFGNVRGPPPPPSLPSLGDYNDG
jgi:hypothetical protein